LPSTTIPLLAGAVPAALLAIIIETGFGSAERLLVPAGLRANCPLVQSSAVT